MLLFARAAVNQLGQLGEKPFLEFDMKLNLIDSFGYLGRYDAAGNLIDTHEHRGDFREW